MVLLLLLLKRIIQKSFSGKAQRNLWIFAAIVFLLPVWKLVPQESVEPILLPYNAEDILVFETEEIVHTNAGVIDESGLLTIEIVREKHDLKPIIYGAGCMVFLLLNFGSYLIFIIKKRKDSIFVTDNLFDNLLMDMKINRQIRLKRCSDFDSPMLTGVIFPIVYLPDKELEEKERKFIYKHEFTHYKHRDLPVKWFVSLINAVNWFNPLFYLVMKNLNEACEIYCDEAVTKNMCTDDKKFYMNTILNLVKEKGD